MSLKSALTQELTLFKDKLYEWRIPIYWVIAAVIVFIFAVQTAPGVRLYLEQAKAYDNLALIAGCVFILFALGLIVTFFVAFKGVSADEARLNRAVTYCYVFVLFSLFGSMLPFFFLPLIPGLTPVMQRSPIGVVNGCSREVKGAKAESIPLELRCHSGTTQWVVNLGGTVRTHAAQPAARPPAVEGKDVAAGTGAPVAPAAARAALATDSAAGTPDKAAPLQLAAAAPAAEVAPGAAAPGAAAPGAAAPDATADTGWEADPAEIHGGLVIPLYVVVLSIMGATVSMTRRVPEYQRRLSPKDPHFMSYDEAREALVFQVMQVCSAPLIAVTMYYLVDPGSRATTIVLAFASGFSSETILLLIRAFLEKIKPTVTSPPPTPTNIGLSPARLDFGKTAVGSSVVNTIAIVNPTAVDLDVMSINCTNTADFSVAAGYPEMIPAGKSVSIQVTFTPQSPGVKNGVLTVTDNAPGSPRAIDMFGEGV